MLKANTLGLGNLIKYEMKAIGRIMFPAYGAFLVLSALFGLTVIKPGSAGAFAQIITTFIGILYFAMAVAILVFTAVILVQRFYRNLLGNEGYLYFTLPVSANAHIANKTLSAGIWLSLTAVAGAFSALIICLFAGGGGELMDAVGGILSEIRDPEGGIKIVFVILEVIVFVFFAFAEKALKIYAAISVGQQWGKHRVLGAIGAWIGFSVLETLAAALMNFIPGADTLFNNISSEFAAMQLGLLIASIVLLITVAIYWFVNYIMLERHLNLQ